MLPTTHFHWMEKIHFWIIDGLTKGITVEKTKMLYLLLNAVKTSKRNLLALNGFTWKQGRLKIQGLIEKETWKRNNINCNNVEKNNEFKAEIKEIENIIEKQKSWLLEKINKNRLISLIKMRESIRNKNRDNYTAKQVYM